MTNSSSKSKEGTLITDNPHGRMYFGPPSKEKDSGEVFKATTKIGHHFEYNRNGKKFEKVPGASEELCGTSLEEVPDEYITKSIVARQGDICIIAENGNLKLKAKNIYVETTGEDDNGSILMSANDHVSIKANEQLSLHGAKVCVNSSDSITLNAEGFLHFLAADIIQGSPLSSLTSMFFPGIIANLIDEISQTCK